LSHPNAVTEKEIFLGIEVEANSFLHVDIHCLGIPVPSFRMRLGNSPVKKLEGLTLTVLIRLNTFWKVTACGARNVQVMLIYKL
jgi:hypothetical protein